MPLGDPREVTNLPVLQVHRSIEEAGSFQGEKKKKGQREETQAQEGHQLARLGEES